MPIVTFNSIRATEKSAIYWQISNKTGIPVFTVEKDLWVVQSLSVKKSAHWFIEIDRSIYSFEIYL